MLLGVIAYLVDGDKARTVIVVSMHCLIVAAYEAVKHMEHVGGRNLLSMHHLFITTLTLKRLQPHPTSHVFFIIINNIFSLRCSHVLNSHWY